VKFIRPTHAIILALVLTFGMAGMLPASAAEGIERNELSRADLSGVEGVEVIVSFQRLQPGARMARHIHYGDETVYALKGGSLEIPDGKIIPVVTGSTSRNIREVPHGGFMVAGEEYVEVLTIHIVDKGKPLVVVVE
jgi:hypothetical protein